MTSASANGTEVFSYCSSQLLLYIRMLFIKETFRFVKDYFSDIANLHNCYNLLIKLILGLNVYKRKKFTNILF